MRMTIYLLLLFGNVIELIYLLSFLQFIIKLLCLVWGKHKRDSKAFNRIFIATSSLIVVHMHNNVYPRYHFGRENYYIPGNLWYSTLFKLTEVWKFAVFAIQLQQHTTCLCSRIVLLRDICFLFLLLLCVNSNAKEEFRQYLIIKPNILSPVLNSLQVFQSSINLEKLQCLRCIIGI